MAITKNRQSDDTIRNMALRAFPDKRITGIKELTEGMCNVTYDIAFDDGSESILKIAAKDRTGNTSNEVNLMQAEINAMKLVSENCSFKVADVQYYDTSNTICDGNYFFMEKLKGDNFFLVREKMSDEAIAVIDNEIGKISRELSEVRNLGISSSSFTISSSSHLPVIRFDALKYIPSYLHASHKAVCDFPSPGSP